ncbi:MAG TPA: hypothetical protein VFN87_11000 [Solirubrobacteraceae bacterium]|nr:hypothetical protein [Solirubrobacteraceae bacterium]
MASTSTKQQNTLYPDLEAAGERIREANERVLEASRKVTGAYLDGVERYVAGLTQFERKLGAQTQVDAVAGLFNAHAKLTDDVTGASIAAARELIAL